MTGGNLNQPRQGQARVHSYEVYVLKAICTVSFKWMSFRLLALVRFLTACTEENSLWPRWYGEEVGDTEPKRCKEKWPLHPFKLLLLDNVHWTSRDYIACSNSYYFTAFCWRCLMWSTVWEKKSGNGKKAEWFFRALFFSLLKRV